MNMPTHRDEPAIPENEWLAQERALRAERLGLREHDDDARTHAYRRIAHALREPLPDPLPDDFAERVARHAAVAHAGARERFDRVFGTTLWLVLLATGTGYAAGSAGTWWQSVAGWMPAPLLTSPWLFSLVACAGLTALLGRLPLPDHRSRA